MKAIIAFYRAFANGNRTAEIMEAPQIQKIRMKLAQHVPHARGVQASRNVSEFLHTVIKTTYFSPPCLNKTCTWHLSMVDGEIGLRPF